MPQATLTLTLPDPVWIGRLSRAHPAVRFRVLSAFAGEETGVGLMELLGPSLDAVLEAMGSFDAVADLEVMQRQDRRALVQFETSFPLLLRPVQGSGIPLEMPFDIVDGRAVWELTASHDRLSVLGEQLEAFGIQYRVERVREADDADELLTDRQRQLVEAAIERGYYDTPRTCTLTELAESVGVAVSTGSEILHRAEGRIIKQFLATATADPAPDRADAPPAD